MRQISMKIFSVLVATVFISSCASTYVVDTWDTPKVSGQKMQKLLVVSIARSATVNRTYEDVLVGELNSKGINAIPGYRFKGGKNDRQSIDSLVKKAGADGVITVQTTGVERRTNVQPGYISNFGGYDYPYRYPYYGSAFYGGGYYGSGFYGGGLYEPATVWNQKIASILVSLFDGKTGNLVWAASVQTEEPDQVVPVSKDLAKIIVEGLTKKGLI